MFNTGDVVTWNQLKFSSNTKFVSVIDTLNHIVLIPINDRFVIISNEISGRSVDILYNKNLIRDININYLVSAKRVSHLPEWF